MVHPVREEIFTMPNQANPNLGTTDKTSSLDEFHTSITGEDKKLDRVAEEAAKKASKTEKKYDTDQGIFTK
jgi:hypothetical protein